VAANAFAATRASFINAMADVCEVASADVVKASWVHSAMTSASAARSSTPVWCRVRWRLPSKGLRALMAGPASSAPIRPWSSLRVIDAIKSGARTHGRLAREQRGSILVGTRVAVLVLAAAFKQDSDEGRDPPALDIAVAARDQGALLTVHDPIVCRGGGRPIRISGTPTRSGRPALTPMAFWT